MPDHPPEYTEIARLFDLPSDFYQEQHWSQFADPRQLEKYLTAFDASTHTSAWIDHDLAELILDVFARRTDSLQVVSNRDAELLTSFVQRYHRRLGVRCELAFLAGLESRSDDPYPIADWVREHWTAITHEPLKHLLAFRIVVAIEDPANHPSIGPPTLPTPEEPRR